MPVVVEFQSVAKSRVSEDGSLEQAQPRWLPTLDLGHLTVLPSLWESARLFLRNA